MTGQNIYRETKHAERTRHHYEAVARELHRAEFERRGADYASPKLMRALERNPLGHLDSIADAFTARTGRRLQDNFAFPVTEEERAAAAERERLRLEPPPSDEPAKARARRNTPPPLEAEGIGEAISHLIAALRIISPGIEIRA